MVNIRANTNGIRSYFEGAPSHLIEFDLYRRSKKYNPTKPKPLKVSVVTFSKQGKTGVNPRWHTLQEFCDISSEKNDELTSRQGSNAGK